MVVSSEHRADPQMTKTVADEAVSFAAFEQIGSTLQRYLDGATGGDAALVRTAFFPEARIQGAYSGQPVDWSLEEFCGVIATGGPAPELVARIVEIDVAGSAGTARLEIINWRGTRYTDFFLLRNNGGWHISGKVFFAHSRA
jgi:hypothetical protein